MSVKHRPYKFKGKEAYCKRYSKERLVPLLDKSITNILSKQGLEPEFMPRSVYRPHKLYEALNKYSEIHSSHPFKKDEHFRNGVLFAKRIFQKPYYEDYLQPLSLNEELELNLSNPKASAGLTWYGSSKKDAFAFGLDKAKRIVAGKISPEPCIAMARTQKNDKTRLVWCYPLTMNIIESLFARPLIDRFKTFNTPMHFGVPQRVTSSKLRRAADRYLYSYSLDYSQFDASLSRELIFAAFRILSSWFKFDDGTEDVLGEELWPELGLNGPTQSDVWNIIVNYFVTSPIVMPDGDVYYGRRNGVPSGSYFTQIIDSICNVILMGMVDSKFSLHLREEQLFVLGDDCLLFDNHELPLESISRFLHNRKVTLNADKCEVSSGDNVHFLGRRWIYGKPTGEMQELINKVCQPETYRKYAYRDSYLEQYLLLRSYASVYNNFTDVVFNAVDDGFPVTFERLSFGGDLDAVSYTHLTLPTKRIV